MLYAPIHLVTLDLDDTIVDSQGAIPYRVSRAVAEVARRRGTRIDPTPIIARLMHSTPEGRTVALIEALGLAESDDARDVIALYRHAALEVVRPLPGAIEAVRRLAAWRPVVVVTNGLTSLQRAKLHALGLSDVLSGMVTSESVGVEKPDPAVFDVACRATGVRAPEAVHIGDSPWRDVAGAAAAGCQTVLVRSSVPHGPRPTGPQPDLSAESLADIPDRLIETDPAVSRRTRPRPGLGELRG